MKSKMSSLARQDIASLIDYIAADNPRASRRIKNAVLQTIEKLENFPEMGVCFHKDKNGDTFVIMIGRFKSYMIFYRILDKHISIDRIGRTSRNWPELL